MLFYFQPLQFTSANAARIISFLTTPKTLVVGGIIGADLVDDLSSARDGGSPRNALRELEASDDSDGSPSMEGFDRGEIKTLQEQISRTTRPVWHSAPPPNLGEPGHGKLKADQWRSLIEFDIPVSIAQLSVAARNKSHELGRWESILHCTMMLACTALKNITAGIAVPTENPLSAA